MYKNTATICQFSWIKVFEPFQIYISYAQIQYKILRLQNFKFCLIIISITMNFFSPMMYLGGLMLVEKSVKVMGRKSKKMSSLKIETLLRKKTVAGQMFLK